MPTELVSFTPGYIENLFLVAIRLTAMLMTSPVFGSRSVPAMAKIGMGLLLAVIMLPTGAALAAMPDSIGLYLIAIAKELIVGLLAGFTITLVFGAIQIAASIIGLQVGLSLASTLDPASAQQGSALDHIYTMLATLIFLGTNGHYLLFLGFQRLLEAIPLNTLSIGIFSSENLSTVFGNLFLAGLQIAAPIVGALFLADVALAVIARTAPQVNVFFVGMPIKAGLGVFVLIITLPFLATQAERLFGSIVGDINILLGAA